MGQLRFSGGGEEEAEEEEVPEQDPPVDLAALAPEDKAETPTPKRKIQFGIGKFFGSPEAKSSVKPVGDTSITPQGPRRERVSSLTSSSLRSSLRRMLSWKPCCLGPSLKRSTRRAAQRSGD